MLVDSFLDSFPMGKPQVIAYIVGHVPYPFRNWSLWLWFIFQFFICKLTAVVCQLSVFERTFMDFICAGKYEKIQCKK